MNVTPVLLLISVINLIGLGNSLECYHCHQTSPECINGVKRSLQTTNCTESKCFVLKYATEMPGVTVLASFRGCYNLPLKEIMKTVVTENHKLKVEHFHLCNYTLCNNAFWMTVPVSYLVCLAIFSLISWCS